MKALPWTLFGQHRGVTALDEQRMSITFPDSSAISLVVYNVVTEDLALRYTSGGEYVYSDVPAHKVLRLMLAESAGYYVNASIKGVHRSGKIPQATDALERLAGAV